MLFWNTSFFLKWPWKNCESILTKWLQQKVIRTSLISLIVLQYFLQVVLALSIPYFSWIPWEFLVKLEGGNFPCEIVSTRPHFWLHGCQSWYNCNDNVPLWSIWKIMFDSAINQIYTHTMYIYFGGILIWHCLSENSTLMGLYPEMSLWLFTLQCESGFGMGLRNLSSVTYFGGALSWNGLSEINDKTSGSLTSSLVARWTSQGLCW